MAKFNVLISINNQLRGRNSDYNLRQSADSYMNEQDTSKSRICNRNPALHLSLSKIYPSKPGMYTSAWVMIGKNPPHETEQWSARRNSQTCFSHSILFCLPISKRGSWHWQGVKGPYIVLVNGRKDYVSMWKSCSPGGDKGGIAEGWEAASSISKIFLAVAWDSPMLPIFLEVITSDVIALEELLLSMDFKKLSLDTLVCIAEMITEWKVPDSLRPWIMTCTEDMKRVWE